MAGFDYGFRHILVDRPAEGVVLFTLNRPERMNATNALLHSELADLPRKLDQDDDARVGVITGAGRAFCVGGDYDEVAADDYGYKVRAMRETIGIVQGIADMRKPLISAITARRPVPASRSRSSPTSRSSTRRRTFSDGHARIGLAAGDHAALIWPLLCGMAKAKRYLLTADKLTGREAERIGLVSECAAPEAVLPRALALADTLVQRAPLAVELTKRSLNGWLRQALPLFEASLGYEMVTSFDPGLAAEVQRGRAPPPNSPPRGVRVFFSKFTCITHSELAWPPGCRTAVLGGGCVG